MNLQRPSVAPLCPRRRPYPAQQPWQGRCQASSRLKKAPWDRGGTGLISTQDLPAQLAAFRTNHSPAVAWAYIPEHDTPDKALPQPPKTTAPRVTRSNTSPKDRAQADLDEATRAREEARQAQADLAAIACNGAREFSNAAAQAHQDTLRVAKERQVIVDASKDPLPPTDEETCKLADTAEKLAKLNDTSNRAERNVEEAAMSYDALAKVANKAGAHLGRIKKQERVAANVAKQASAALEAAAAREDELNSLARQQEHDHEAEACAAATATAVADIIEKRRRSIARASIQDAFPRKSVEDCSAITDLKSNEDPPLTADDTDVTMICVGENFQIVDATPLTQDQSLQHEGQQSSDINLIMDGGQESVDSDPIVQLSAASSQSTPDLTPVDQRPSVLPQVALSSEAHPVGMVVLGLAEPMRLLSKSAFPRTLGLPRALSSTYWGIRRWHRPKRPRLKALFRKATAHFFHGRR